ncbi:MAG: hypothetical protein WC900_01925 [Oscillospiraceae bacterium]|jgi:hypothetical protein
MEKLNFVTFVAWTVLVAWGYYQVGKAAGRIAEKKDIKEKMDKFYVDYMSAMAEKKKEERRAVN